MVFQPAELPKQSPKELADKAGEQEVKLKELKSMVENSQFDTLTDSLMGTAAQFKGEIPTGMIDKFTSSLSDAERQKLVGFLSPEKEKDARKKGLLERLTSLKKETGGAAPAEFQLSEPTQRIVDMMNKGIGRLLGTSQFDDIAKKFGFKNGIGSQQDFVKNIFMGAAAKLFEGLAGSLKKINPAMDISQALKIPLELRLLGIKDPVQREKYRVAYLKKAAEPGLVFIPPTLQQALNPAVPASPEQAKPQVAQTEKVEGTKTVTLADGNFSVTRADKKLVVEFAGTKKELTLGADVVEATIRQPSDKDAGGVTVKLADNRIVTLDPKTLRESIKDKKTELLAADGVTKAGLLDIKNT